MIQSYLEKKSQAMGPMARPDAYTPNMPGAMQMMAPYVAGAGISHAMAPRGTSFMSSAMRAGGNPLLTAASFAAPGARRAQIAADRSYLANARSMDVAAGLPKVSAARRPGLGDLARRLIYGPPPKHPIAKAIEGLGARAGALAVALPIAGGVYSAGTSSMEGLGRARDRAAEPFRRNRALNKMDLEDLHDQGLGRMLDDPERLRGALHKSFRVLNKYAPTVARDPELAAGVLTRLAQDSNQYQSPTEYLRQVREAVDLEGALRNNRPTIPHQLATFLTESGRPEDMLELAAMA